MKAFFLILTVLFTGLLSGPGIKISYAQNCVCAECNYPCKTPMVHASNCKYRNNRATENEAEMNSETKSINKSEEVQKIDIEYQLLLIHSSVRSLAAETSMDKAGKEQKLLEQKTLLGIYVPENEAQKLLYERINEDIENALQSLKKQ